MAGVRFANIQIDNQKCLVPFFCKKCLEVCPTAIFNVMAVKVEKGLETDPKDPGAYALSALYPDKCTACNDCIGVCPEDAITITYPS